MRAPLAGLADDRGWRASPRPAFTRLTPPHSLKPPSLRETLSLLFPFTDERLRRGAGGDARVARAGQRGTSSPLGLRAPRPSPGPAPERPLTPTPV